MNDIEQHTHKPDMFGDCAECNALWEREYEKERRAQERAKATEELLKPVIAALNGGKMSPDDLSWFLMGEHPTLLGQFAKGTALGVVRRTVLDPKWKPYDKTIGRLSDDPIYVKMECHLPGDHLPHPEHDGRLSCDTVVGAELMARQAFI